MDDTTLETLEFPAVLNELAANAATPLGHELSLSLVPIPDPGLIKESLKEFAEGAVYLKLSGRLPLAGLTDIAPLLNALDPVGSFLLPEDLLRVRENLSVSSAVSSINNAPFEREYPRLSTRISSLSDSKDLYKHLKRILDDKGAITDDASPALSSIRREIRAKKKRARTALERVFADKDLKESIRDEIITVRDDRYVLSVKAGMQAPFKGIIHGRSGSGSTFFVEPLELVELNNGVAELRKDEKTEEIEVLKEAARRIVPVAPLLLEDTRTLAALDLVQAKALLAASIGAVVPMIKTEGDVRLMGARHPLLVINEKKGRGGGGGGAGGAGGAGGVVPIDIILEESCKVLVISGANTGGKTVALKTLGLLTLMALSGLPVPVDEGSELVVFGSVFADIGDRQDIIASLSTFSAHVKRMVRFLEEAGSSSLVLIDEIGGGTDPSEAAALAGALLDVLKANGARTIITTHLNALKARAQIDAAYTNASVEFDERTLNPLYKLCYGVPGPSLGLSIAESLGIPAELIKKARASITEGEGAFVESINLLEQERSEVEALKARLARLSIEREEAVARLKKDRDEAAKKAASKIARLVSKATEDIGRTVAGFKEQGKGSGRIRATQEVGAIGKKVDLTLSGRKVSKYVPVVGDRVAIAGSSTVSEVIRVDASARKAELLAGALKLWASWDKLDKKSGAPLPLVRGRRGGHQQKAGLESLGADTEAATSINIIGLRVEEAISRVTRFVDNAHAAGLARVEIIHGKGTGRLKKAVGEFLRASHVVKSLSHGSPESGGAGVTIAELV